MPIPIQPNATCDIYHVGNAPPAAPDVPAVPCFLVCDWRRGQEGGDRNVDALTWTHTMLVDIKIDLRDAYAGQSTFSLQDTVYVSDHTGTAFVVVFVERVLRGTANEHQRAYLDRKTPTWPTTEL